jgi:hypothetical protein
VAGFIRGIGFHLPILIPPNALHSSVIRWNNRPISGWRTRWTQVSSRPRNPTATLLWLSISFGLHYTHSLMRCPVVTMPLYGSVLLLGNVFHYCFEALKYFALLDCMIRSRNILRSSGLGTSSSCYLRSDFSSTRALTEMWSEGGMMRHEECHLLGCDAVWCLWAPEIQLADSCHPDEEGDMSLRSVSSYKSHATSHPRRRHSS